MVINHNWINSVKWIRFLVLWSVMAYQVNATIAVNVYTREGGMSESNASKPYIYVQNTGDEVLTDFVYYYYFQTENNQTPVLDIYYLSQYESAVLETVASGYRIKYTITDANIAPGGILPNSGGNSVALHYNGWTSWDKTNDFSNNLNNSFQLNNKVAVYVGGVKVYGSEPDTATAPPLAPDSLSLTVVSWQRIDLLWVDSSDNESGFRIERSTNNGPFVEIGTTAANITNYQSTGLTANTLYSYRIRAYNNAGNSDYCANATATTHQAPAGYISREIWTNIAGATVSAIPLDSTPNIINTINILETTSNYGDSYGQRIRGFITAPATGEYTFWIASDDNSELWLSTNDQPASKVKIASVTGYTNSREWNKYSSQKSGVINLSEGAKYYIEILHKEGDQNDNLAVGWLKPGQSGSVPSEVVPGTVLSPFWSDSAPAAPSGLIATVVSSQRIDLSWSDNSSNESGFRIERSSGSGVFTEIGITAANVTTYQSTGLTANTAYSYRVRAYNAAVNSDYCTVTTATTHLAPEGYISRDMWTNVPGTQVSDIPVHTTPNLSDNVYMLETSSNNGNNYGQRIRGYITAPATGEYTFWIASDDNSELWLSTNNQPSNKVIIASVTGYTNSREWNKYSSQTSGIINLLEGVKYYIEILHKEGDQSDNLAVGWIKPGQSGSVPSEIVPGNVLSPFTDTTIPDAPDGLHVNSVYSTQIGLVWTDNSLNETGFKIERSQGTGTFTEIAVVPANATTFLDNGLTASTEYRYKVLAYNSNGNSAYSNVAVCTTTVWMPIGSVSASLLNFAIYSTEQSIVNDRSLFSGGGNVGSNGYIEIGANANVYGNLVSAGNIQIRSNAKVYGNVSANGKVTIQDSTVTVSGTLQDSGSHAIIHFPLIPPVTIGSKDTVVLSGQVLNLLPGMYDTLIVESFGKVKFSAGTYTFSTLIVRPDAEILYEISMYDYLEIFINNEFEMSDRTKAKFAGTNTYSPAVRIYTNDPNVVRIGTHVPIAGIIFAPQAEVQISDGVQLDGAIYAKKVKIDAIANLESGVVNPDGDFDNDYVPTFSEYKLHTNPRDPLDYTAIGIPDNAMIDNTVGQTVNYDYSIFFTGYSRANSVKMTYASGNLTDPSSPVLFQIRNLPISAPEYNESDYIPIGRYLEPLYNTLNSGESISVAIPLPDNTIPGTSYKVAIYRSGAWEELDGTIGDQAVYADVTGDLGPMILIQKPSQAVYYFDNSVYSNQQVTRIEIDLMIKVSVTTANPPGTFTLNYTDYSVDPSGTNESIFINFERLEDSTLVARGEYTFYGRVVVNSASVNISSPDSVTYTVSNVFDLDKGQSLLITNEKTVSEMKGNANIPDKLVFSYGGNNLAFEYTSLNGEGQIRRGSAGNYYYNYYLKDHLGSTRMVINDAGDITDAIMYQPYGTMEEVAGIATPGADPERERFTGKEFDREGKDSANGVSGLSAYYFGARFFDPEIGMWLTCDPSQQFWSPYGYTGNGINSIIGVDPDGRDIAVFSRPVLGSRWNHLTAIVYNRAGGKPPVTISLIGNPQGGRLPKIEFDNLTDWEALICAAAGDVGYRGSIQQTQILSQNNTYIDEEIILAAKSYVPTIEYPIAGGIFQKTAFNSNTFMHQFMLSFGFLLHTFHNAVHQLSNINPSSMGNVGVQTSTGVEWFNGEIPAGYTGN